MTINQNICCPHYNKQIYKLRQTREIFIGKILIIFILQRYELYGISRNACVYMHYSLFNDIELNKLARSTNG